MTVDELFSIKLEGPDQEIRSLSEKRWDSIAKPIDGLGELERIITGIAAMRKNPLPELKGKALIIMCADNGVVEEGVSQTGKSVTFDVACLMGKGKSSVGKMTAPYPLEILVYDIGIDSDVTPEGVIDKKIRKGTADFLKESAMTREECLKGILTGMEAVRECSEKGADIIATGEMGIGNTTTATAVISSILGIPPEECTGKGSGLSDEGLDKKIRVIKKGLELYPVKQGTPKNEAAFETLRCLGGLDIAGLAGVFIGGAMYGIPVVVDGLISAAAALVADRLVPGCREYMIASHLGREKCASYALNELSLTPVIHADLALGEGTGAVMLFPILDMAAALFRDGTAFKDTDIKEYERFDG